MTTLVHPSTFLDQEVFNPMYLPPLQPPRTSHVHISGNVFIDESATLAPGVLLRADTGSRILIAAGVCIGMGTILHAHQGNLEIAEGAILGAGVLILGRGQIGANACIGSATTILNSSIPPGLVITPGSLIGDQSRPSAAGNPPPTLPETEGVPVGMSPATPQSEQESGAEIPPDPWAETPAPPMATENTSVNIYGQVQLSQLLGTLMPYRQAVQRLSQEGTAPDIP
ncbi:hypothetical protein [Neosynechococcus sphagnicola]|nr:hypothetical protein [Neosynechococcus sphagnicola]